MHTHLIQITSTLIWLDLHKPYYVTTFNSNTYKRLQLNLSTTFTIYVHIWELKQKRIRTHTHAYTYVQPHLCTTFTIHKHTCKLEHTHTRNHMHTHISKNSRTLFPSSVLLFSAHRFDCTYISKPQRRFYGEYMHTLTLTLDVLHTCITKTPTLTLTKNAQ